MIVNKAELAAVGVSMKQYPEDGKPEIAFVGRSNVGKSTLINGLMGRKALARTSSQPGKTRTINFYNIEDTFYFVDLPGYGYAKASKAEKEKWGKMIEEYLYQREPLQAIVMLVDIRHAPSKDDQTMYEFISFYNYPILIVATKLDKIKKSQKDKHLKMIRETLSMKSENTALLCFSGATKEGKEEIWQEISEVLANKKH